MNLHPLRFSTAIAGTIETPIPADTIARMPENCPLSKTMLGSKLDR